MDFIGVVLGILVFICVLVVLPLFYEITLTLASALGFKNLRTSGKALRIAKLLLEVSDKAERGIQAMVVGMITIPIYVHFQEVLPLFLGRREDSIVHIILVHLLPSVWINSNMLFNYYHACVDSPGYSENSMQEDMRVCAHCRRAKPAGVHHCGTCKQCVVQMDHHCPFTANCVGKGNFRRFFLFVLYSWLATTYAFWLVLAAHGHCDAFELDARLCTAWRTRIVAIAALACGVLTVFLIFLVILTLTGRTTRAFLNWEKPDIMPNQSAWNRLQARLGPVHMWWLYLFPFPLAPIAEPLRDQQL